MPSRLVERRIQHFSENYLVWCSLAHFLSADLTREYCEGMVSGVTKGRLRLDDLFEYTHGRGGSPSDVWIVLPSAREDELDHFLQRIVRTLVWMSDGFVGSAPGAPPEIAELEAAIQLGRADFGTIGQLARADAFDSGTSVRVLQEAVQHLAVTGPSVPEGDSLRSAQARVHAIAMPLRATMLKHLGDLCADADRWGDARSLYVEALRLFDGYRNSAWSQFTKVLSGICRQSVAAALRTTSGPAEAAQALTQYLGATSLASTPLFHANASHDAMVAATLSPGMMFSAPDRRATAMVAPQFLSVLDTGPALEQTVRTKYQEAHRLFWGVLRRQIALGSAQETRGTKAQYGRSLLDDIANNATKHFSPDSFRMAVRLLLESGDAEGIDTAPWSEALIGRYVDDDLVETLITHARKYHGSEVERTLVLVQVFLQILEYVRPERVSVVRRIGSYLARLTVESETSLFTPHNIGGSALQALKTIGTKRPELRAEIAPALVEPLVLKITSATHMLQVSEAIETAKVYLGALSRTALKSILVALLGRLSGLDAATTAWPIVRPAMDILTSSEVTELAQSGTVNAREVVQQVVRFGLAQATEQALLLDYLARFYDDLVAETISVSDLEILVADVRKRAIEINSTGSPGNITALLMAPKLAKREGVFDAVSATSRILKSVATGRPSISFAYTYQPLMVLADRQDGIARDIGLTPDEFRGTLRELIPALVEVWRQAAVQPALMNGFALPPPTAPNPVIVHNWTFASIGFSRAIGEEGAVTDAIGVAAQQPLLADAIAVARAVRVTAGDPEAFDEGKIRAEDADAFYAALGQRLLLLQRMPADSRKRLVGPLVDQCLRHGPNGLDAGVFLLAIEMGVDQVSRRSSYRTYQSRLGRQDRELRFAISPLLRALG